MRYALSKVRRAFFYFETFIFPDTPGIFLKKKAGQSRLFSKYSNYQTAT